MWAQEWEFQHKLPLYRDICCTQDRLVFCDCSVPHLGLIVMKEFIMVTVVPASRWPNEIQSLVTRSHRLRIAETQRSEKTESL